LLNASRGSEQYHDTKSSMANSYARFDAGEPSAFKTALFAKSKSGSRRTCLATFLFRLDCFISAALLPPDHIAGVRWPRVVKRTSEYSRERMRIDPKGAIRGYPTLLVRRTLRSLRGDVAWGQTVLEKVAKLKPGAGRALVKALEAEGLIEASPPYGWIVTQAGDTLSVATAAKPVSRPTAERALTQFLGRVARVNEDSYFLARVTRVALYGSMLQAEVNRLSDVDLAVQLVAKETNPDRLREVNAERLGL
jgi:hypothetical protein